MPRQLALIFKRGQEAHCITGCRYGSLGEQEVMRMQSIEITVKETNWLLSTLITTY